MPKRVRSRPEISACAAIDFSIKVTVRFKQVKDESMIGPNIQLTAIRNCRPGFRVI